MPVYKFYDFCRLRFLEASKDLVFCAGKYIKADLSMHLDMKQSDISWYVFIFVLLIVLQLMLIIGQVFENLLQPRDKERFEFIQALMFL